MSQHVLFKARRALYRRDLKSEARRLLSQYVNEHPHDAVGHAYNSLALRQAGKHRDAYQAATTAMSLNSASLEANAAHVIALVGVNRLDEAIDNYKWMHKGAALDAEGAFLHVLAFGILAESHMLAVDLSTGVRRPVSFKKGPATQAALLILEGNWHKALVRLVHNGDGWIALMMVALVSYRAHDQARSLGSARLRESRMDLEETIAASIGEINAFAGKARHFVTNYGDPGDRTTAEQLYALSDSLRMISADIAHD
ncbi:MAG: hypothetical protein ABL932_07550 [Terricaulis sp.]